MLKKLITLMMVLSIFTVQAHAAAHNGLKNAFDELTYSLNVEWDQKDKAFYQSQMKKFTDTVSAMQTEGLTNAEMIDFLKSEVKDERVAGDLQTAFNMISLHKMSSAEATQYMIETLKNSYSRGANWNGDMLAPTLISAAIIVGFVVLFVTSGKKGDSGTTTTNPGTCNQQYICNNFCYHDAYFGYTCQPNCFFLCY